MNEERIEIISVREHPNDRNRIIAYFQKCWSGVAPVIYEDCITHCIAAKQPLPQWYVLMYKGEIIGGAGLIPNDFISRMDCVHFLLSLLTEGKI